MSERKEIEWRPIYGYPYHFAGSHGFIRRDHCFINGKERQCKILGLGFGYPYTNYIATSLVNQEGFKIFPVHRIICAAFHHNEYGKLCVNHKDRNRRNNKPQNLEWVTHVENSLHLAKCIEDEIESYTHGTEVIINFNKKETKVIGRIGRYLDLQNGDIETIDTISKLKP